MSVLGLRGVLGVLVAAGAATPLLSPTALNGLRFADPSARLSAEFVITLQSSSSAPAPGCGATPSDVAGPFHIAPENTPANFPARSSTCVTNPTCLGCGPGHPGYTGGLPLTLTGRVVSASACGASAPALTGAVVDIWQADPNGAYWKDTDVWSSSGRRLGAAAAAAAAPHHYNCRAHSAGGASSFNFTTYLPGYYRVGGAFRPRHIHVRAQAPGHATLVTQLYFHGDRLLGAADIGCCNSGHADLVAKLTLEAPPSAPAAFSLCELPRAAGDAAGQACENYAPPPTPTPAPTPELTPAPTPVPQAVRVTVTSTVTGFTLATFDATAQRAYRSAFALQNAVPLANITIANIANIDARRQRQRQRQLAASGGLVFDVVAQVDDPTAATALRNSADASKSAMTSTFAAALQAAGVAPPAGMTVTPQTAVVSDAVTSTPTPAGPALGSPGTAATTAPAEVPAAALVGIGVGVSIAAALAFALHRRSPARALAPGAVPVNEQAVSTQKQQSTV